LRRGLVDLLGDRRPYRLRLPNERRLANGGLGASIGVTRLMSSLLFGVSASDPATYALVPVLLGVVTIAACVIPARRATRVSPMEVLK
jgi:ABC-type antimicrobial peptide transport system permease subunit